MIRLIAIMVLVIVILGLVGRADYDDAVVTRKTYCEMVNRWDEESARGIPEIDRAGWPAYNGECE